MSAMVTIVCVLPVPVAGPWSGRSGIWDSVKIEDRGHGRELGLLIRSAGSPDCGLSLSKMDEEEEAGSLVTFAKFLLEIIASMGANLVPRP